MTNSTSLITIETLKDRLPEKRKIITQEAVDLINQARNDPEFQDESLLDIMATYKHLLGSSRSSIVEYINALRFCAFLGDRDVTDRQAYIRVFNQREFVIKRKDAPSDSRLYRELSTAVTKYKKTKLVVDILTMAQIPLDIMFMGQRYKALEVLASIASDETAHNRDRVAASKELLAGTKPPENLQLNIGTSPTESSAITSLVQQLAETAQAQAKYLTTGHVTLKQIGELKAVETIEGEMVEEDIVNE